MRILQLISGRGPTGPAAAALVDARALRAAGHSVVVACRDRSAIHQLCHAEGIPVLNGLELQRGARRLLTLRGDAGLIRRGLQDLSIDVLHVHRSDDQLLAWLALDRRLTVTLVRTWHRDPSHVPGILLKRMVRHADGSLTVAREHLDSFKRFGAHSAYVPPAVDTTVFTPGTPDSPPVIAQVGRWKREKGQDRGQRAALDVFAALPRTLDWNGVLLGRGEEKEALESAAWQELGLAPSRVTLQDTTGLSLKEFAAALRRFSIGLIFETGSDGTSRAATELLASGVPLLVADRPGLRELAEDPGGSVIRLLPNDPAGWGRAIEALLRDPARLASLRTAARHRAESTHALAARGTRLAEFYESL